MILIAVDSVQLDILSILDHVVFAHQIVHPVLVLRCVIAVYKDTISLHQILALTAITLALAVAPAIVQLASNV